MKKIFDYFRPFYMPFVDNLSTTLFLLGLFFVFIGAIFGKAIDEFQYVPLGSGEAVLKSGSAILGAGVFAIVMKSAQFTTLFQQHIFDVFYSPESIEHKDSLLRKWNAITNALLKNILPTTYNKALDKIEKQFFNSQHDYHFEDHSLTYIIKIDSTTNVASVRSVTSTNLVLSPCSENPCLNQHVEVDGNVEVKSIRFNDNPIDLEGTYRADPNNPQKRILDLPLKEYINNSSIGDQKIKYERVLCWTQDLKVDPCIAVRMDRFIKGSEVKVKIIGNYKVHFEKFGLGQLPDNCYCEDDGLGFERWKIITSDDLLLPGQGYILVLVPKREDNEQMKVNATETV